MGCKQSNNCSKIKNGRFFYFAKTDNRKIIVDRTDSVQIETDPKTGESFESKIKWISECNYQLFMNLKPKITSDSPDKQITQAIINIEIISVKSEFYVCKGISIVNEKKFEVVDTLFFLK